MREFFRPYNKVLDIGATDYAQKVVLLTDTSGGTLDCNYITVTPLSGSNDNGMFQVVLSGTNTMYGAAFVPSGTWDLSSSVDGIMSLSSRDRGPSGYNNANVRASNSASGVLGLVANGGTGTVIFSLAPHEEARAIIITHTGGKVVRYVINYGHVVISNPRADNIWDSKEQTWTP